MAKNKAVKFKFCRGTDKIHIRKALGLPAFYINQPTGRLEGIVFSDKEFAMNVKEVAEWAIKHFEQEEKASIIGEHHE